MKKIIIGAIAATMLSGTANAVLLGDHFKKYGYTKPSISLTEIQEKIDNGTYWNYPYIAGKSTTGLFEDKLKKGTAIPQILNGNRLLHKLQSGKKLIVASNGLPCLPVFEELAKQNGISCDSLIDHLETNQADDEDMFSNISTALAKIETKLNEMIQAETSNEITNEVSEEVTEEVVDEVTEEVVDEITEEVVEEVTEEVMDEIERDLIQDLLDTIANDLSGNDIEFDIPADITTEELAEFTAALNANDIAITSHVTHADGSTTITVEEL